MEKHAEREPRFGLAAKTAFFFGLVVLVATTVVGLWIYKRVNDALVDEEMTSAKVQAETKAAQLAAAIGTLRADVASLAVDPTLRDIARAQRVGASDAADGRSLDALRGRLEQRWTGVLQAKPQYAKIRYIGVADEGREIVRVERTGAAVRPTAIPDLQRNGDAAYFQDTIRLDEGEVYLSEINLNREHGRISEPRMPVLRAASPVFDEESRVFGIVIVNMSMQAVFEVLRDEGGSAFQTYAFNEQGDFLLHPQQGKAFAFEEGTPYLVKDEFGDLGGEIQGGAEAGVMLEANREDPRVLGFAGFAFDPLRPGRRMGFVLAIPEEEATAASNAARNEALPVAGFMVLIALACGLVISRSVVRPLGGEPAVIEAIAGRVAEGDLDIDFGGNADAQTGILRSIRRMVDSLRTGKEQSERQYWLKTELGRLTAEAQRFTDPAQLAQSVVSEIATLLEAGHGALYMPESEDSEESLVLRGSYAFTERKNLSQRIEAGQGLVGQCVVEKQSILLTQVPPDYVSISSGLGEARPLNVLVTPLLFQERVLGVIELASFKPFDELQRELLGQLASNLGVVVNGVLGRRRTEELLEESQRFTEELQAQSEELQAQSEELQATNEELEEKTEALARQKNEMERKNEALDAARREVEKKAREVEQSSRYKSEFLANMSHELRTPLNSLLILSRSLAENRDDNLSADEVRSAEVIHSSGQDLLQLINDILDLSKVEAGKLTLNIDVVPLDGIVKRLDQQFRPLADQKGVDLRIDCADGLPSSFSGDAQRTDQILKNLLSNALKFTERGSVTLRIARPENGVTLKSPALLGSDVLAFEVQDTGMGISEDRQQAIWEAFQQADGSTSRKYGGTGLGLTISKELAQLLGGEIHLKSREGEGSTFTLYIPLEPAEQDAKVPDTPLPTPRPAAPDHRQAVEEGERVLLIVEDDAAFAEILAGIGRTKGYRCLVTDRVRSGIQLAKENRPAAVLLDLGLPDGDGMEVLDELKRDASTRHIPVHVISAHDREMDSLDHGALSYLAKPATRESLEKAFAQLASSSTKSVRNVLVVEDDEGTRLGIARLLQDMSVTLSEAASGAEALDRILSEDFDCIILDLGLGDMSGSDLLRRVEESGTRTIPPVVVYTGRELTREEHAELSAYAQSIVVKGAASPERLVDEVSLFLHSVETSRPQPGERSRRPDPADDAFHGERVLVVDDDLRNTFALSRVLEASGFDVTLADNGKLALEKLEGDPFDLVLMDVMMPVMDGYETMREIRKQQRFQDLPIIALTAKAMPEDRGKCIAAGANDYLTKPVDVDKLLSLMRVWLSSRKETAA